MLLRLKLEMRMTQDEKLLEYSPSQLMKAFLAPQKRALKVTREAHRDQEQVSYDIFTYRKIEHMYLMAFTENFVLYYSFQC